MFTLQKFKCKLLNIQNIILCFFCPQGAAVNAPPRPESEFSDITYLLTCVVWLSLTEQHYEEARKPVVRDNAEKVNLQQIHYTIADFSGHF